MLLKCAMSHALYVEKEGGLVLFRRWDIFTMAISHSCVVRSPAMVLLLWKHSDVVIASVYANPTQFASHEDFEAYPSAKEDDRRKLEASGCDIVFEPLTLYPHKRHGDNDIVIGKKTEDDSHQTFVSAERLEKPLCGITRPHFFRGVATAVTKLFNIVEPDIAVFGLKDYQQFRVVTTLTRELNYDIEIIGVPTCREEDGLAMSSRNALLHPDVRPRCIALYQGLLWAQSVLQSDIDRQYAPQNLIDAIEKRITDSGGKLDYVKVVDTETLRDISEDLHERKAVVVAAAAFYKNRNGEVAAVRLIDNMWIDFPKRGM